jgi:hypothetical protein
MLRHARSRLAGGSKNRLQFQLSPFIPFWQRINQKGWNGGPDYDYNEGVTLLSGHYKHRPFDEVDGLFVVPS